MLNFVKRAENLEETYIGGMGKPRVREIRLRNLKLNDEPFGLESVSFPRPGGNNETISYRNQDAVRAAERRCILIHCSGASAGLFFT